MNLVSEMKEFLKPYEESLIKKEYKPRESTYQLIQDKMDVYHVISKSISHFLRFHECDVKEVILEFLPFNTERFNLLSEDSKMKIYRIFDSKLTLSNIDRRHFYFFLKNNSVPHVLRTEYLTTGKDVNSYFFVSKDEEIEYFYHLKSFTLLLISYSLGIKKNILKDCLHHLFSIFSFRCTSYDFKTNELVNRFFSDDTLSSLFTQLSHDEKNEHILSIRNFYREHYKNHFFETPQPVNMETLKEYFYLYEKSELLELKHHFESYYSEQFSAIKELISDDATPDKELLKKITFMIQQLKSFDKCLFLHEKNILNFINIP